MRRFIWLVTLFFTLPLFAQYPELDAVREAIFAKDLDALLKHLPASVGQACNELTPAERNEYCGALLIAKNASFEGKFTPGTGDVFLTFEQSRDDRVKVDISLKKRISDGVEAVLLFDGKLRGASEPMGAGIMLWMRYEDHEWRIWQLSKSEREVADLSDPKFVASLKRAREDANSSSAVGSLRTYSTALVTYSATYPEIGFAATLDALGPTSGSEQPTAQRAGLLDDVMSTSPYQRSGYRFIYRPDTSKSPIEAYTIVAIPIGGHREGQRSYFTDESGVIRYTEEDREPNVEDKALQ